MQDRQQLLQNSNFLSYSLDQLSDSMPSLSKSLEHTVLRDYFWGILPSEHTDIEKPELAWHPWKNIERVLEYLQSNESNNYSSSSVHKQTSQEEAKTKTSSRKR